MTGCRVGKIKLKGGGEIYRLPVAERDEAQKRLVSRAAMIAGYYEPGELVGFAVLGWNRQGRYSVGYLVDAESPVGFGMLPSFAADTLRRRMIEEGDWESNG